MVWSLEWCQCLPWDRGWEGSLTEGTSLKSFLSMWCLVKDWSSNCPQTETHCSLFRVKNVCTKHILSVRDPSLCLPMTLFNRTKWTTPSPFTFAYCKWSWWEGLGTTPFKKQYSSFSANYNFNKHLFSIVFQNFKIKSMAELETTTKTSKKKS